MPSKSAATRAKKRYPVKPHERASQPRTSLGKFLSNAGQTLVLGFDSSTGTNQQVPDAMDLALVEGLVDDPDTNHDDKLTRAMALYARWKYEDTEEQALEGKALIVRQQSRCRELGLIVFGFQLHDAQVEAICTLFYNQRNLLLLAKTGFRKSLIFQLVPFMNPAPGVLLILIPLKLLQAEQCEMINRLPQGKAIVLNGENSQKSVFTGVARGHYTHIFTSSEIALSKKFKKCILDQQSFTDRLCFLAIDEIHLIDEWDKSFRPMYAEIENVRKRISCHVSLLGVSAIMTKSTRSRVLAKAGFLPEYRLMQTSLDRPEIMQIYRFMDYSKASCLDLQLLLPKGAQQAKDIQKTVIFVNAVAEIRHIIMIIQNWMKKLEYPEGSSKWIRPYHSLMSECDKKLTAEAFRIPGDKNNECIILVAIDAYGMGIDNPDVKLVVQWDFPLLFDSMIQRMGRAGRKGGKATFLLFTPKWSKIKDQKEVEEQKSKNSKDATTVNAQLSDKNRPISRMNQVLNADNNVTNADLDAGLEAGSEVGSGACSGADFDLDDADKADLVSGVPATKADKSRISKKKEGRSNKSDAAKRANLPDEMFEYIHVAQCQRLYSLAWYDDMTYAQSSDNSGATKTLPQPCCNGPRCQSEEPEFMKRDSFIDTSTPKYMENDREWIAYRGLALKVWRKETSDCL